MPYSDKERQAKYLLENDRKRRLNNPEYFLWKSAKKRARDKELDFDIEVSDIIIPQFCPLLHIPITHRTGTGKAQPDAPSLDRLDNALGYVKGNIIVISWRANKLKADAEFQEMQRLVNNWGAILRSR